MSDPSPRESAARTRQVFLYFGPLTLFIYLAAPGGYFIDIATTYMLKNRLHATAHEVAMFRLLTGIPMYFAFVFGLLRDLWNPIGRRDRGYFLLFAPLTAAIFFWLAYSSLTYQRLFAGMLLLILASRVLGAAHQGLLALIGQEKLMSGRLAALWQVLIYVPYVIGASASGYLTEHVSPSVIFGVSGLLTLGLALIGLWKPAAVFAHAYERPQARGSNFVADVKRLVRHRAIYPAVLILFLFQFAPGQNTPLQYYLTNQLHAPDTVYGNFFAIFTAAFIPMMFIYGWLCKRFPLRTLLWWGTIISIPQNLPLAFITNGNQALVVAGVIGFLGALAAAAYFDLAMRSCPPGLQGTLMMLVESGQQISYRGGDWLGTRIFEASPARGFFWCVVVTSAVYALIIPLLLLIPKQLIATADGEPNPLLESPPDAPPADSPAAQTA